jgi:hypothetical protein
MNKRLHELGEKWTITAPTPKASSAPTAQPPAEGHITTWIAYGDDSALLAMTRLHDPQDVTTLTCSPPFTCFSEDQLKATRINLDFTGKTKRRLIFMIGNTGTDTIQTPNVNVALGYDTLADVSGIALSSPAQNNTAANNAGLDWVQPKDFLPYSTVLSTYDLALDVEAKESSPSDFQMVFKVSAPHLRAHLVPVYIHIVRN